MLLCYNYATATMNFVGNPWNVLRKLIKTYTRKTDSKTHNCINRTVFIEAF